MALEADQVLLRFLSVLDQLSIPYVVSGSLASGLHGEPRSTHDSDVLIALRRERARALVVALRPEFYVDEQGMKEALDDSSSFNVIHIEGARKIDLYVAGEALLDREQLARRVAARTGPENRIVQVTSAEVIVLRKLDWYRREGEASDRQLRDVVSVLRVQRGRMDDAYLDRMAAELDLVELLERARKEAR